jgi:hypothetical protein
MKATVTVGPKTSLKIEADDNLLPLIETPIKDGHLVVQFKDGASVETKNPILLTVTTPRLSYIEGSGASVVVATASKSEKFVISSSGASKVDASGVDSGDVSVSASGASRLKLIGSGKAIKIELSGASRLDATGFSTDTVHIDASGASSAQVQASGSVAGELSGASKLEVAGSPSKRSVETSGVSHVSYK